nr:hypothetical protein [Tanacetum cinerariifolium]
FLRGTSAVVVILVKRHAFPTIVKVRSVGCDPLALVDGFTPVEDNIGLSETRFDEEANFVIVFPEDVKGSINLTFLVLFIGFIATNFLLKLLMQGQNKDKRNMVMQIDKLHKFSDGTLTDVRTALDDRLKGIQMQYLPQSIWRKSDKDKAAAMIQAIDKRLKTRRIMRSLERDDHKIYKIKEGKFKRLRIQDIEDMLMLLVQGKLTNLTVEERFAFNVSLRMFTRSIVIQSCVEDLQLGFGCNLPQSIWRKSDKDRAAAMIQAIDKRLKTRRIMRSLDRYKVVRHRYSNPMIQPEPEGSTQGYPLVSVEVLRYDKRSKTEYMGIVPTEMELILEHTQQGISHEVSIFEMITLSMCHKTTLASDTLIDFQIKFPISIGETVTHWFTLIALSALRRSDNENMLSLMKLILMSILTDSQVTPTNPDE